MMFELNRTLQHLPVYRASALTVTDGVSRGEALSFADEIVLDDSYTLHMDAPREILSVTLGPRLRTFRVAENSAVGTADHAIHLDCSITLMGEDSTTCEVLVLVEENDGLIEQIYALPIGALDTHQSYRVITVDRHSATRSFAEIACVSFGAGTMITMADGQQKDISTLAPGDMVLTRDSGPKPVRWVGHMTLRAQGSFTPVVIRAGALNNARDLTLSPDHRVLVYQRSDALGAGQPEVMVKVRHLVDGDQVAYQPGGHIDYVQLLFDSHEIIYAEGIAAESLLVDGLSRAILPDELANTVTHIGPEMGTRVGVGYEVAESLLSKPDAVELLRKASAS